MHEDKLNIKPLITEKEIRQKLKQIAVNICNDYQNRIDIICVLKGSFIFCADLIREIAKLNGPELVIHMIKASSYIGEKSKGKADFAFGHIKDLSGRDVLIVEDIVDTGITIKGLFEWLKNKKPRSIRLCSLLSKPSRRLADIKIDYLGFSIDDKFVVGYGLDYNEKGREYAFIGQIITS